LTRSASGDSGPEPAALAALFDELVDRAPDERAARLAAVAPELRRDVESLLRASAAAGRFLERPAPPAESCDGVAGERVGAWRLVSELGRGGMGTVWLAERADGAFEQRAALKRIRGGFVSESLARRFLFERQLLARLSHPNIARLLDGGLDERGSPYLVLEHVRGTPIDLHCDDRRLSLADRLALFSQVCDAVRHAHSQLVIHRDLKPSNIFVDEDGRVKLLDFGVAKLLADDAGTPAAPTLGGLPPCTPDYAAPEQLAGGAVTTATDVYSLGVVLWELLAGERPRRDEAGGFAPILDRPTAEAAAAARSISVRALRRQLAGDLGAVVARALERVPAARYPSVEALAEDLARTTRREPVRARSAPLARRVRLFVARNRLAIGSAAIALSALVSGLVAFAWQGRVAARERDVARREAARAEEVEQFLVGLFEGADPAEAKGVEITARELLDRGASRVELDLAGQPAAQAELLQTLARVDMALGRYDRSRTFAERALVLARKVHGPGHPSVARALALLGNALVNAGESAAAIPLYREALAIRRQVHGDSHEAVGNTLNDLAIALHQEEELAAAEALYREAISIQRARLGPEDPEVATTLGNLAGVLSDRGDHDGAALAASEAIAILRRRFGDDHPLVPLTLADLAKAERKRGRLARAEELYREALAIQIRLLGGEHPDVSTQRNNLARLLLDRGEFGEAEQELRRVLELDRRTLGAEHPYVAISLDNLGSAVLAQGRAEEALSLFRDALEMHRRLAGETHPRVAVSLRRQAEALAALGRDDEALVVLDDALARFAEAPDARADEIAAATALREKLSARRAVRPR
jgi:serine/threonine-protein kinase